MWIGAVCVLIATALTGLARPAAALGGGGKIAFDSGRDGNSEIYVINADGTDQINLTKNPASDAFPSFSRDGTKIAFGTNRDGNDEIYVMNADGTNPVNVTQTAGVAESQPALSPDGTKIAFMAGGALQWQVWVMNIDGTNRVNLSQGCDGWMAYSPAFSPDGTKVAFEEWGYPQSDLNQVNVDGTGCTNLTNSPAVDNSTPAYSPDGTKIAFTGWSNDPVSGTDGNFEVLVMNADGTNLTNVSQRPSAEQVPAYSPDGTKIAFFSDRDGNGEIYAMNADGSNQVNLTNSPGSAEYRPSWAPTAIRFSGFSEPVTTGAVNVAKAGQAIPLKFRITDYVTGTGLADLAGVTVQATSLACQLGTTADQIEEYASGASGLQNLGDGYYQYNWKTPKSYANSCKTMTMRLTGGGAYTAEFAFTK